MKAVIEYNLADPDDRSDFEIFKVANGLHSFAFDLLYTKLRNMIKHETRYDFGNDTKITEEQIEILEYLRTWCFEYLAEEGINLEVIG